MTPGREGPLARQQRDGERRRSGTGLFPLGGPGGAAWLSI